MCVATADSPPEPATVLAAATLARRRSDPSIGGRMRRARRFRKRSAASCPSEGLLRPRDHAVMVEGLGCLSMQPAASEGPEPDAEVSLPVGVDASLSSGMDNDDEELGPQTPLAATNDGVFGSVCGTADVRHDEKKMLVKPCDDFSAGAAAHGDEEGWVQVGRGGSLGLAPSSVLQKEGLERSLAFKRWARGRCFRCLKRDHQVSTCCEPFRCIRCHRPGHRERFCRARFPAALEDEVVARAPSPVARAPCHQSCSSSAQPPRPSSPRSWAEVVGQRPSPRCCGQFKVNATLDSLFQSQVALMRLELFQLVDVRIEEATRSLREEVASLRLLLARGGVSLEPAEACPSGGMGLAKAQDLVAFDSSEQKSYVVEEEQPCVCLSPCGPSPQPSEMAFIEALAVATTPSPPSSPTSVGSMVLAHSSEALFARELCGLLTSLEVASPGYGKDIDRVLAGNASEDLIRKVKKSLRKFSLRGRRRKMGVASKDSTDD